MSKDKTCFFHTTYFGAFYSVTLSASLIYMRRKVTHALYPPAHMWARENPWLESSSIAILSQIAFPLFCGSVLFVNSRSTEVYFVCGCESWLVCKLIGRVLKTKDRLYRMWNHSHDSRKRLRFSEETWRRKSFKILTEDMRDAILILSEKINRNTEALRGMLYAIFSSPLVAFISYFWTVRFYFLCF